jgi:hypothetical protein
MRAILGIGRVLCPKREVVILGVGDVRGVRDVRGAAYVQRIW